MLFAVDRPCLGLQRCYGDSKAALHTAPEEHGIRACRDLPGRVTHQRVRQCSGRRATIANLLLNFPDSVTEQHRADIRAASTDLDDAPDDSGAGSERLRSFELARIDHGSRSWSERALDQCCHQVETFLKRRTGIIAQQNAGCWHSTR